MINRAIVYFESDGESLYPIILEDDYGLLMAECYELGFDTFEGYDPELVIEEGWYDVSYSFEYERESWEMPHEYQVVVIEDVRKVSWFDSKFFDLAFKLRRLKNILANLIYKMRRREVIEVTREVEIKEDSGRYL